MCLRILSAGLIVLLIVSLAASANADCAFGRGRPKAECGRWFVINSAAFVRFADSNLRPEKAALLVAADFGYMWNVGERYALGASIYVGVDDDDGQFGILGRYRRFLTDRISLDVNAGFATGSSSETSGDDISWFLVQGGISGADWVSLMMHVQVTDYIWRDDSDPSGVSVTEARTETEYFVGLRFGSYASAIVPFGLMAGLLISLGS